MALACAYIAYIAMRVSVTLCRPVCTNTTYMAEHMGFKNERIWFSTR